MSEMKIRPKIRLMYAKEDKFYGPGVHDLLLLIQKTGSVQKACEEMGLSYSKGRRLVRQLEQHMGVPMVERWIGGSNGGGARITEEGLQLMKTYETMLEEISTYTNEIFEKYWRK
ncbi:MAG: LysR family transcriptional regulator [Erysipelotrichaceae bacterium]|nr:LysR family transcriptional regulator [Erysipelotrichaceae bacterium]